MKYSKFVIKNFKGIKEVEVNLSNNRILTLVGLNESGKTTILEAINLFYKMVKGDEPEEKILNTYRPKGIDFSGDIEITGYLDFEDEDIKKLEDYLKEKDKRTSIQFPETFNYTYKFKFKTHKYQETSRSVGFHAKSKKATKTLHYTNNDLWNDLVKYVKSDMMPEILFYEDFTFKIPDKVEFKKNVEESSNKTDWQLVLDDILKAVNPELSSFQIYVANIWDSDNDTARNRISSMERLLDSKITTAWKELFKSGNGAQSDGGKRLNFKEIKLVCSPEGDNLSISFKVRTDLSREFAMNERSKGCMWFFSFLIFTEFRKKRTKNILFLLDEPASNLHSSAQSKILEAIEQLSDESMVIYSTHSHHLINPIWLSGAYVVINESISDDRLEGDFIIEDSAKITTEKYYNYVGSGKGGAQHLYYQPILDCLDYAPSNLEPIPNIVITEGKYDWYTYKYFSEVILDDGYDYNFYPGAGCNKQMDVIRLYLSWGANFLLMLDGDAAGLKAKKKYLQEFDGLLDDRVYTYVDILGKNCATEALIDPDDKESLCDGAFGKGTYIKVKSDSKLLKSKLNFAINQLLVSGKKVKISKNTSDNFKKLFKFIRDSK